MSVRTDQVNVNVIINGYEKGTTLKQMEGNLRQLKREVNQLAIGSKEWTDKMGQVNKLQGDIKNLKGNVNAAADATARAKEQMKAFGMMIGAMAIAKIIEFGKASVHAFLEAEKIANQLMFTMTQVGNATEQGVRQLITQSEELQNTSIFPDDEIQKGMQLLAAFDQNKESIEKLMPVILDYATITGKSVEEATNDFIKGANGQDKALKMVGITIEDTGSKTGNFNQIVEKMAKFQGSAQNALETTAGKAKRVENAWDNVMEAFGEDIVNQGAKFLDFWDLVSGKMSLTELGLKNLKKELSEATTTFLDSIADKSAEEQMFEISKKTEMLHGQQVKLSKDFGDGKMNLEAYRLQQKMLNEEITRLDTSHTQLAASIAATNEAIENDKTEEAKKKAQEYAAAMEKLGDQLKQIGRDQELATMNAHDREIAKAKDKYDKLRKEARGNSEMLKRIQELESSELLAIDDKYFKQRLDKRKAAYKNEQKLEKEKNEQDLDDKRNLQKEIFDLTHSEQEVELENSRIFWTHKIEQAKAAGLDITALTLAFEQDQQRIRDNYHAQDLAASRDVYEKKIAMINAEQQLYSNIYDIASGIFELIGGKSSEFAEFQKKLVIFQIAIDTASAISKAIATGSAVGLTPIEKSIAITGNIALVLANMIKAKEILSGAGDAPKYEYGGVLSGPSHSNGGIDIVSGGRKIGEAQGGEPILSRRTYANNRGIVDALLYSSMRRNGAPIDSPFNYRPRGIAFSSVRESISSERAGNFSMPSTSGAAPSASSGGGMSGSGDSYLQRLYSTLSRLNIILDGGISAKLNYDKQQRDEQAIDTAKRSARIGN